MIRHLLAPALLAAFALAAPALAQDEAGTSAETTGQNPVEITADTFTVNENESTAIFTGNVVVIHPTVTVRAPKVTVLYGEGGTSDIVSFEATGNVELETEEQDATGARAVFDPAAQTLRLSGDVRVTNASGTVSGPELLIDLASNTSTFTSTEGGRVTGVFNSP